MLRITYTLIFVYALPLFFILFSIYSTEFFSVRNNTIYVADAITGGFFNLFRDTFGSIIVPLVTAYTLPERKPDTPISKEVFGLFFVFIGLFLLAVLLYAVIRYSEDSLSHFNVDDENGKVIKDIPKIFYDTITAYGKETLAYVALVLGISLKK